MWGLVDLSGVLKPTSQRRPSESKLDEFVTNLYRRFKDWSKRGFNADDVTWCEVRAEVATLLEQQLVKDEIAFQNVGVQMSELKQQLSTIRRDTPLEALEMKPSQICEAIRALQSTPKDGGG